MTFTYRIYEDGSDSVLVIVDGGLAASMHIDNFLGSPEMYRRLEAGEEVECSQVMVKQ